jgi:hypothetical protein
LHFQIRQASDTASLDLQTELFQLRELCAAQKVEIMHANAELEQGW